MKTVRGIASMPLVLKKVIHMKAVLAVVLAAVLFAGCGDGSAAPELTPIPTATTAPTPTPIPMLELGSVSVAADVEELTAADAALQELLDAASFFTGLHRMDVSDCGFDTGELLRLQEAYPETEITARLTLYGQEFLTDAVELDFSGTVIEDTTELEAMLPLMHKLEKVIMSDCGLSNEEMDALNKRHEDVRFVWTVYFGRCYYLRTDETAFIGSLFQGSTMNYSVLYDKDAEVLKYCEDMVALDLGHMQLTNCEFVRNMPHLRYLILADNPMQDISALAGLEELWYLEIFNSWIREISPLLECPNLRHLNISYLYLNDVEALEQMTQLERLWFISPSVNQDICQRLEETLSDTELVVGVSGNSTGGGWRQHDAYFEMRDAFGAYYIY